MIIREMKDQDYEQAKKLVYQGHTLHCQNRPDIYCDGNPLPRAYFDQVMEDDKAIHYVCEENHQLVGLLMGTKQCSRALPILKEKTTYFIETIVVDRACRRRGIGKQLYDYMKETAIREKVDGIELNVWAFNESAIKFYESLGMSVKNMKLETVFGNREVETKQTTISVTERVGEKKCSKSD